MRIPNKLFISAKYLCLNINKRVSLILNSLYYSKHTLKLLEKFYGSYACDKPIKQRIDLYTDHFVLRKPRLKFKTLLIWSKNPYSVIVFIILIFVNTILRTLYIVFFWAHIIYWLCELGKYIRLEGSKDLKPSTEEPVFTKWYLLFFYIFTWKRAYLYSYNTVYTLLRKITTTDEKRNPFYVITKLPFIAGWYLLRLLTSIPRSVILDSYNWSGRFTSWIDMQQWTLRIANGVTCGAICFEMGPLQRKRIYRKSGNIWNFNPDKITTIYNLAKKTVEF